jgi:hypothetical protein
VPDDVLLRFVPGGSDVPMDSTPSLSGVAEERLGPGMAPIQLPASAVPDAVRAAEGGLAISVASPVSPVIRAARRRLERTGSHTRGPVGVEGAPGSATRRLPSR